MNPVSNVKHLPGSDLTQKQLKAAASLRRQRPACMPGSAAIIDKDEATAWHTKIADVGAQLDVRDANFKSFCDACGVAE
jgi:hypothetical protein